MNESATSPKRVLIIEDDRSLLNVLTLKLSHEGFAVEIATDGKEGLERIKNNHYDIILLDIIMPGIDGFGVLTQLKEKNFPTKVVVISSLSQKEDIMKAKELGAYDYIVKPETPINEVVKIVKQLTTS